MQDNPIIDPHYGNRYWMYNGKLHRQDGPAIEYPNGNKKWYRNGRLHREDGPAIEYAEGDKKYWYLNGEQVTEDEVRQLQLIKQLAGI